MAALQISVEGLVELFKKYAGPDKKLDKDELKRLIDEGITDPDLKAKLSKVDVNTMMARMDENDDGQVDFAEFMKCVTFMALTLSSKKFGL